jgi:ubiquinone/menaquinone biosynthesis C-methylase UbiE
MNRIQEEKDYWNEAALDPNVDEKYICNLPSEPFFEILGGLEGKVLEIGCGVGRLMKDGYCGIDVSENMLAIAKDRKPKCEFKITDGRSIPYPDETFDGVYCVLVFQHLPADAVQIYIDEAMRVLKPDGTFIFQYIEGREDAPFSKGHFPILKNFRTINRYESLIHPQWTWIKIKKWQK